MITITQHINNYLEYCSARKHLDVKTIKAYRIDLYQYAKFTTNYISYLSKDTVDSYITFLHKQYQTKTIKRKIASLKAFFHHLEYLELLTENPFSKLDLHFREAKLLPKTISLHNIEKFISTLYIQKDKAGSIYQQNCCLRDIAVIELLFASGMRISELCSLKSSDIDLENHSVLIYGKGAKERLLPIENPDVITALTNYYNAFENHILACGYFFVNRLHQQLSDQSVRYMINHYAHLAGLQQHLTPHMFRHSFATLLLEQDVDIRYIQKILGHSSISVTEIYTHVSSSKQREILLHKHPRNLIETHNR